RAGPGRTARHLPGGPGGAYQHHPPRSGRPGRGTPGKWRVGDPAGDRGLQLQPEGPDRLPARRRLWPDRDAREGRAARRDLARSPGTTRLPGRALVAGMTEEIRVLIADDQRVVREGLATLLGLLPGVTVVAAVGDG